MAFDDLIEDAGKYYSGRFAEHGAEPRGVDWRDSASQHLRFHRLLDVIEQGPTPFSITDYGCGYGALVEVLERFGRPFSYQGFDVAPTLLAAAEELHGGEGRTFVSDAPKLTPTDYVVASGLFNVKQLVNPHVWQEYIVHTLRGFDGLARCGFAFNMLTSYSEPEKMRPDLYYADPCVFFDLCKREFSQHVALRHDYGLWEFTISVVKSPRT